MATTPLAHPLTSRYYPTDQQVVNYIAVAAFPNFDHSVPEGRNEFLNYIESVKKGLIVDVAETKSVVITVKCSSLQVLEGLWYDYCTGHLSEVAQEFLVTGEILKELGLAKVILKTVIPEEEYTVCKQYFIEQEEEGG